MKIRNSILLVLSTIVVGACKSDAAEQSWFSTDCSADVVAGEALGIKPIPDSLEQYRSLFCKYTEITAPNGKPIRIFAQNDISNEQLLYARALAEFYLQDFPGSRFGADKSAVANALADNEHTLSMLNGRDGQYQVPFRTGVVGQALYDNETPAIGTPAYIDNDYERRDAAFEEILHFVHDAGIGIDFPGAPKGAAPEYQKHIRAAATNALPDNTGIWADDERAVDWLEELREEGSITQEYLASVIDSYYGLWGPFTEAEGGMWGLYVAKTREEIAAKDPMGYEVVEMFFHPYLTFPARVDPGFDGIFRIDFDPEYPYTHKSQYLVNVVLLGVNSSGVLGNAQDNRITGNRGNNTLDGGAGEDTVAYTGNFSDYEISRIDGELQVVDRRGLDGTDVLYRVEYLEFADRTEATDAL